MPSKNSLAALKTKDVSPNSLPSQAQFLKMTASVSKAWRKAKPIAEKASKPITLKFTPAEFELIEDKAGLINKATFIKSILSEQTTLLQEETEE